MSAPFFKRTWVLLLSFLGILLSMEGMAAGKDPTPLVTLQRGAIFSLSYNSDGKLLATVTSSRTIKIWSLPEAKEMATLSGHKSAISSVAFSPDGKTLASAGSDQTVRLWDTATWKERDLIRGPDPYIAVAYSPDGKFLATAEQKTGLVRLWEASTMLKKVRFEGPAVPLRCLAFSPDFKFLACGYLEQLKLWDVDGRKEAADLVCPKHQAIRSVAFSPDGKILASAISDGTVKLWDVTTQKELHTLTSKPLDNYRCLQFSPDGKIVASGGIMREVVLWDVATGQERRRLKPLPGEIHSLAFAPDDKTLAIGIGEPTVWLWEWDDK